MRTKTWDPSMQKINWLGDLEVEDSFVYKGKKEKITTISWSKDKGYYVELENIREKVYEKNIR